MTKRFIILILCMLAILCLISCHKHSEEIIAKIEPTCTRDGYTEGKKCSDCGDILVEPKLIPSGHKEEKIPSIAPTCTKNGYTEGKKCAYCNKVFATPQLIPSSHSIEIIKPVAPTCTSDGNTQGIKCSACDEILSAPEIIPGGHKEEIYEERIDPEIGESGYTEGIKCSVCKEIVAVPQEISLLSLDINEELSTKGKLSLNLVFEKVSGNFTFYYADSQRQRLSYFNQLASFTATTRNKTLKIDQLIIPSDCEYIIAENGSDYVYFAKIPDEYILAEKNFTYTSLSDVHTNNGRYLDNALDFLDTYGEIDFVAISGDISDGAEKDLLWFNEAISGRTYKTYTTTGNHDEASLKSGLWLEHINTGIKTDNEVFDIGENGLDFVYIPEKSPDSVFVFLCQTSWWYSKSPSKNDYMLLKPEQLTWLEGVLEKYKDKAVLLYFHTFLSAPDGTQESAVGNLRNPGGYAYDLPYSYGSADEVIFRGLMKEYKNVVFFSGHSHWMFELEKYNKNLNVSNFDGEYCYMVHNPSVCTPRWIGENDETRKNMGGTYSEGWIIEIYDDTMILIPVDFINQVFYTEYMKIIPIS